MEDHKETRISNSGASPKDPFPGRTVDGYRIEELVGRGGMGEVYRATQLSLNRPVALKVLPPDLVEDQRFLDRFEREVDILSRLSHPNIVTVFERGEVDGQPYLVMEFVQGTSLREVLKRGPLPATEALLIVRGVLSALEHAHAQGIIHRDIKPENILLAPGGVVKVADFGLSRLIHGPEMTRLTQSLVALGTYEYMAPEQREQSKDCDERSDLYATGVVLYEAIAGELPIGHFDPLSKKRPEQCDSRIDQVVERSLKKAPTERFQEAAGMGDAVSQLISRPALESRLESIPEAQAAQGAESMVRPGMPTSVETDPVADSTLARGYAARMEDHLSNLAMIDKVLAVLLILAGSFWFVAGMISFSTLNRARDEAIVLFIIVGMLWFVGAALCAFAGWALEKRRPGAPRLQMLVAGLAALTVLLLPFSIYVFWTLASHRGRRYYAARSSGMDPEAAARQVDSELGGQAVSALRARHRERVAPRRQRGVSWTPGGRFAVALLVALGVAGALLATYSSVSPPQPPHAHASPVPPRIVSSTTRVDGFIVAATKVSTTPGVLLHRLRSPKAVAWVRQVARPWPGYPDGLIITIVNGNLVTLKFARKAFGNPRGSFIPAERRVAGAVAHLLGAAAGDLVDQSYQTSDPVLRAAFRKYPPPVNLRDEREVQLVAFSDPSRALVATWDNRIFKNDLVQEWVRRTARPDWNYPEGVSIVRTTKGISVVLDRSYTANGKTEWTAAELRVIDALADVFAGNMEKRVKKSIVAEGLRMPEYERPPGYAPPRVVN